MRYICYYRVSTSRQSLGIDAQRAAVARCLAGETASIVAEFTEKESGKVNTRPELEKALALCRVHRATLIVANVSRLTRSLAFLSRLLEAKVDVRFADLPSIEGATGRFLLQQMASVAELEAGLVSERTKAALVAAKARGVKLGGYRGHLLTDASRAAGRAAQAALARTRAIDLLPIIDDLRRAGVSTLRDLASGLTERNIPTARGKATWSPYQVWLVLKRVENPTLPA